ncbi:hypothetical protein DPMN_092274 [Dreissena polymorpha]|uniref:Uncharacterized protein n=1 Tax=Dreissena polymorpha TaxID=45954 RepID=A0A9D4R1I4_DREPO|nr:hypothetical protein DPMN_092274 [Dreissena polymorpha]
MAAVKVGHASIFRKLRANIIGMIHLPASPGTPGFSGSVNDILLKAAREAAIYKHAGVDSVLIENMHDIPYLHSSAVGPEVVSVMTAAASVVRSVFSHAPVGVQILAGANQQALAVALAAGLDFIRAEGFVYSHVADEGIMDACAGPLLRYRRHIGAQNIAVFTDIKKKHSAHSITSDVSIAETARAAEFFRSDGVIVTGKQHGTACRRRRTYGCVECGKNPGFRGIGRDTRELPSVQSRDRPNYWLPISKRTTIGHGTLTKAFLRTLWTR